MEQTLHPDDRSVSWFARRAAVIAGLATAVLVLLLLSPPAQAGENLSGDVDCSGAVEALDATGVLREIGDLGAPDCIFAGDVDCDGDTDGMDALLILRFLASLAVETEAGCPAIATPIDGGVLPLSFTVDPGLEPSQQTIEGINGGPPRQLASIRDSRGNQADFVANELLLNTDDQGVLNDFIDEWNGEVLATFDAADLAGGVQSAGGAFPAVHLVRIDTSLANPNLLPAVIRELDSGARGEHFVSSPEGLGLLAAGAAALVELDGGDFIGVNWVMYGDTLRERTTTEAASGPGAFTSDAYDWSYLTRGSEQDIGVTEAWTALAKTSKLGNKSTIAVIDGGFSPDADYPEIIANLGDPFGTPNPDECSGGSACPFHGSNVVHAAMGVPDNSFGAAGPGGPVSRVITAGNGWDMYIGLGALVEAQLAGADIINMSFGAMVPASLSWSLAPFNMATANVAAGGTIIFASAGNDGIDIDAEDCAVFCWEEAWKTPCENAGVVCVGALDWNSKNNASYSNYGLEDVDIFAPGTVFVGPDPVTPGVSSISGTSFASPFMAGVAALVWAADPTLSANEVMGLLMTHAHDSPRLVVERYVNAWGAVKEALGGNTPPNLDVNTPVEGATYGLADLISFSALATDDEDGTPDVTWISHRDGLLGTGILVQRNDLSAGTHIVTATATDSGGLEDFEQFTIEVIDQLPLLTITNPPDGTEFFQGQDIHLSGTSLNPDVAPPAPLPDSEVQWSREGATAFAIGHNATIPGGTLPLGDHGIYFETYDDGRYSFHAISITILEDPPNLPPSAQITSPADNSVFLADQSDAGGLYRNVTVVGSANDPEDGALSGDSLQWHYREGDSGIFIPVGTGASRNIKLYAHDCFGTDYQIRLIAIDGDSNLSTPYIINVTITGFC